MKKRELLKLGYADGPQLKAALETCVRARAAGVKQSTLRRNMRELLETPTVFLADAIYGELAKLVVEAPAPARQCDTLQAGLKYNTWGDEIDPEAHKQMENACRLPVSVSAALMPDAHVGYGLPIGGVLATDNAVIPYAVGVDIACRVMLTVFDLPLIKFQKNGARFERVLEENTRFGIGARWQDRRQHAVMDENWGGTPLLKSLKDLAWSQLGTSGSGNHFVEFGEFTLQEKRGKLEPGTYLALVSHSGSRGAGSKVASYYSSLARSLHRSLPPCLHHLAWLPMDGEGLEYWQAMELMGKYASANHHIIHESICRALGEKPCFQVENHHNFAWREEHGGRPVIVHRKGATPAGKGVLGYIPGSMVAPGYLVEGLGNPASLNSCSHGAGRQMSRTQAKKTTTRHQMNKILADHGVQLISAGLDETPLAYKDIEAVMNAQSTLVRKLGRFTPKLVKMAPEGERAED